MCSHAPPDQGLSGSSVTPPSCGKTGEIDPYAAADQLVQSLS